MQRKLKFLGPVLPPLGAGPLHVLSGSREALSCSAEEVRTSRNLRAIAAQAQLLQIQPRGRQKLPAAYHLITSAPESQSTLRILRVSSTFTPRLPAINHEEVVAKSSSPGRGGGASHHWPGCALQTDTELTFPSRSPFSGDTSGCGV